MAEPNNTPQPESPVVETTPLLASHAADAPTDAAAIAIASVGENLENGDLNTGSTTPQQQLQHQQTPAIVRISTLASLVASLVAFGVLIAGVVVSVTVNRYSYAFNSLNEAIWGLELTLLAVILFDSINIHKLRTTANTRTFFPLLIQIPVDLFLTIFILNFACQAGDAAFSFFSCPDYGSGPACERWLLVMRILIGCGIGAAATAGLAHLSLIIIRAVAFFQGRIWTGSPWMIPAGQLTFEFSIKFLRQER